MAASRSSLLPRVWSRFLVMLLMLGLLAVTDAGTRAWAQFISYGIQSVPYVEGRRGTTVVLSAKVVNSVQMPASGRTVTFKILGGASTILAGAGVTDGTGWTYVKYHIPAAQPGGDKTIVAQTDNGLGGQAIGQGMLRVFTYYINTDLLTIEGSSTVFEGLPMLAVLESGIARFYIKGDISVPAGVMKVLGHRPLSLVSANNVTVASGAKLDVSASGSSGILGGGKGGNGGSGGSSAWDAIAGQGGSGGRGGGSYVEAYVGIVYFGENGSGGLYGQNGHSGSRGGAGLDGYGSPLGGGLGGAKGPGGARQIGGRWVNHIGGDGGAAGDNATLSQGGQGGKGGEGGGVGKPGIPGTPGFAGVPGANTGADFTLSAGSGGAGGGGGGGGSQGTGGGGGGGGGSGGLVAGGMLYEAGIGGDGGTGGIGAAGGAGGRGGKGGGGGGAVEIAARGRIVFAGSVAARGGAATIGVAGTIGSTDGAGTDGFGGVNGTGSGSGHGGTGGAGSNYGLGGLKGDDGTAGGLTFAGGGGGGGGGGAGGIGGDGAAGGPGSGGSGGGFKLYASVVLGRDAAGNVALIDTTGGAAPAGGSAGGNGRFIIGQNNKDPFDGHLVAASITQSSGVLTPNPFVAGTPATPTLPDLVGGAEAFGLLTTQSADLKELVAQAPPGAVAALVLAPHGVTGYETTFVDNAMLLLVNLSDGPLSQPVWGVGPNVGAPLLQGGVANCQFFASDPGPVVLQSIPANGIYAMAVPWAADEFNVSATLASGAAIQVTGAARSQFKPIYSGLQVIYTALYIVP